jgi:hypothetical protein
MGFDTKNIVVAMANYQQPRSPAFAKDLDPSIDLSAAGIQRVGRVIGVKDGMPMLDDNRTLDVKNVIWCTRFTPGFSWIDLPVFDEIGDPVHSRGIVSLVPGLYFVGLQFLYSMTSATVHGVGRDAEHIAKAIASHAQFGGGRETWNWSDSEEAA